MKLVIARAVLAVEQDEVESRQAYHLCDAGVGQRMNDAKYGLTAAQSGFESIRAKHADSAVVGLFGNVHGELSRSCGLR